MVGGSKGTLLLQLIAVMEMSGDRMNAGDGECVLPAQGRQKLGQLMGQTGFAAAGGTDEQKVVATCGRQRQGSRCQASVEGGRELRSGDGV